MKVEVKLFGAFRDYQAEAFVRLDVPAQAKVADVRSALSAYAGSHWPQCNPKLLDYSAFASEQAVLRESDPIPADGQMAVLPPVSGG